jgi:hypothetical protein
MKVGLIMMVTAGVLMSLWVGWGAYVIYGIERPQYEVVERLAKHIEVRQYGEQTWISTVGTTDNASFSVLASYIFGNNKEGQNVAMTAPVITDGTMSFILPSALSEESAPTPNGQPIQFTTVAPRQVATLKFSWLTNPERVEKKTAELLAALSERGIRPQGDPFLMRYNDPWTPPFMRRNEIGIVVESLPAAN